MLTASRAHHHSAFLGDNLCSGIGESLHAAAEVRQGGVLERSVCVGSDMDQCVWVAMGCLVEAQRRAEWWSVRPTNCRCVCVDPRSGETGACIAALGAQQRGGGGWSSWQARPSQNFVRASTENGLIESKNGIENDPAWRDQKWSRLARPKMVPPGEIENDPAWRDRK